MGINIDPLSDEFQNWLERHGVPYPHFGGTFVYCPHRTPEVVKEPKKKPRTIWTQCKFKTKRIRKYARHYRRCHGNQPPLAVNLAAVDEKIADAKTARVAATKPKYVKGDIRRREKAHA